MQWRVSDRANGNGNGVGVGVLSMSLLFTGSTYSVMHCSCPIVPLYVRDRDTTTIDTVTVYPP